MFFDLLFFCFPDVKDLERKLRKAIIHGHSRTNRPWKRIIIVVEGVYRLVLTEKVDFEKYYSNNRRHIVASAKG